MWRWKWELYSLVPDQSPLQQEPSLTSSFSPGQSCQGSVPSSAGSSPAELCHHHRFQQRFMRCLLAVLGAGLLLCSQNFCQLRTWPCPASLLFHSPYITPSSVTIFFNFFFYATNYQYCQAQKLGLTLLQWLLQSNSTSLFLIPVQENIINWEGVVGQGQDNSSERNCCGLGGYSVCSYNKQTSLCEKTKPSRFAIGKILWQMHQSFVCLIWCSLL